MSTAGSSPGISVELHGFGRVGRALWRILPREGVRIRSVTDRSGIRFGSNGARGAHVFVDATTPQYRGDPADQWIHTLEQVLEAGKPVVTCNKAPLALAWNRLDAAARRGNTTISCSGTVGGGTPILHLLDRLHASLGVSRVTGALSATLGHICSLIGTGLSIPEAVLSAQRAGWAEPDPQLDLRGTDARAKATIVHNLLYAPFRVLRLDPDHPPLEWNVDQIRGFASSETRPSAISVVERGKNRLTIGEIPSYPDRKGARDGLASVNVELRDGSVVSLAGPGAGPAQTAGAVLGDLLALRASHPEPALGVVA